VTERRLPVRPDLEALKREAEEILRLDPGAALRRATARRLGWKAHSGWAARVVVDLAGAADRLPPAS